MPTDEEIETKAREIYLSRYGCIGGQWQLVDTKGVWREKARQWFSFSGWYWVRSRTDAYEFEIALLDGKGWLELVGIEEAMKVELFVVGPRVEEAKAF